MKLKKGEVWSYKNRESNQVELGVIVGATGETMVKIASALPKVPIFIPELYDEILFDRAELGSIKNPVVKCSKFVDFSNEDLISKIDVLREEEINLISEQLRKYFI